ncbi:MAG TPA: RnfABCDGE type electron transport complex subunit D [Vicinamibacterales bacterium]|nr:RnfABCDGE type electron transport complex subunit D [Vicinamibacterales bacterium]
MLKFFRTPKGLLLLVLVALTTAAATYEGRGRAVPGVLTAVGAAAAIDVLLLRRRHPRWEFPGGGILTGLIVAMILSPFEPWYVPPATSAIAIISKHVIRTKAANIFNPAALALVLSYYAFGSGQSWWGALPSLPMWAILALFASGAFIADRVNKMPAVMAFLGAYYLLFTVTAYVGDPGAVAGIFRAPDLHAVLYFAFFMVTDPPTVPITNRDQCIFGVLVAVVSYALFELSGVVYYLLGGLLVGNAWEAWRRMQFKKHHTQVRRLPAGPEGPAFEDRLRRPGL